MGEKGNLFLIGECQLMNVESYHLAATASDGRFRQKSSMDAQLIGRDAMRNKILAQSQYTKHVPVTSITKGKKSDLTGWKPEQ